MNCIHYRPALLSSSFSRCSQFGNKDVVTGEVVYQYADVSRRDECGPEGKYFNETTLSVRAIQFVNMNGVPISGFTFLYFLYIVSK